jgi:predicted amidohydrolase YtcJ
VLIARAEIYTPAVPPGRGHRQIDLRIENGRIAELGSLAPRPGERCLDARGGAVLPGLHDHHLHFLSYAAALNSLRCGPPEITSEAALSRALAEHPATGAWLRGIGYHESVAGDIDRFWLDRRLPDTPARIQHRSGRLWILNSAALEALRGAGAERLPDDGRIYDQDLLMGDLVGRVLPPVALASARLASFGVTGFTDMTPTNDPRSLELLVALRESGQLRQHVCLAGSAELPFPAVSGDVTVGPTKVHLHDSAFPPFDALCGQVHSSHERLRPVAVHCVTDAELVFALAAFRQAGVLDGDRIEHASVTPPELLTQLAELGLKVVTQPNFIEERGDAYLADIPAAEHGWLYRARSFLDRGIPLAAGTDAPFGDPDPWLAIRAAVARTTHQGRKLGLDESLSPEQALGLFLGAAESPDTPRTIEAGSLADLCVLREPWASARDRLASTLVTATIRAGELIFDGVD